MASDIGRSKNGSFHYPEDGLWENIQGWIQKMLYVGGKEVLIKSLAQAIPTFSMACFKFRRCLRLHINLLIMKFWWGSKEEKRNPA
jgi:hypothetical protein